MPVRKPKIAIANGILIKALFINGCSWEDENRFSKYEKMSEMKIRMMIICLDSENKGAAAIPVMIARQIQNRGIVIFL